MKPSLYILQSNLQATTCTRGIFEPIFLRDRNQLIPLVLPISGCSSQASRQIIQDIWSTYARTAAAADTN